MSNLLITDYSYLRKDLESLKSEIWEEMVNCSTLLNESSKLHKGSYGQTFSSLHDRFLDIWEDCYPDLEKTKQFNLMLFLNKHWKALSLLRRMKKTLRDLRTLRRELERELNYLDLHG